MDKGFGVLERLVYATNLRHRVHASNIANTDTPGYKAKEVDFKSVMDGETGELAVTNSRHIRSGSGDGAGGNVKTGDAQTWGDDNNVVLDMEIAKMTENAVLYETGVKLLSTKIRMFKNAVRGR